MDQNPQQSRPPAVLLQQDSPRVVEVKRVIADAVSSLAERGDPLAIDRNRRFCPECGQARQKKLFRRAARGSRPACYYKICMPCRARMKRERKDAHEESLRRKAAQVAIKEILRGHDTKGSTVSDVANAMIRRFGGLESFASEWYAEMQKTRVEPGVSRKVVNEMYIGISKLISDANASKLPGASLETLSSEDIATLFQTQCARLLGSHPHLLAELAEQHGYTLSSATDPVPELADPPPQTFTAAPAAVHEPAPEPEFAI